MTDNPQRAKGSGCAVPAWALLVWVLLCALALAMPAWSPLIVELGIVAWGAFCFWAGFVDFDPDVPWNGNAFWDAIIGRKWSNRLAMLIGAAAMGLGAWLLLGHSWPAAEPLP
jgi:hypothetical protein